MNTKSYAFSKETKQRIVKLFDECNDFKCELWKMFDQQDIDYQTAETVNSDQTEYTYTSPKIKQNYLVELIQKKKYSYIIKQKFLLEQLIYQIKTHRSSDYYINLIKIKGDYQADGFIHVPIVGWVNPGFKVRSIRDVYFILSLDSILIVSQTACSFPSTEMSLKLNDEYADKLI